MTPGDVPCERPCATRWCIYNQFGVCTDNATCEEQMDAEGNLTHKEVNND